MNSQYGLVSPIICFIASAMYDYKFGVVVELFSLLIGCLIMLIVVLNKGRDKNPVLKRKKGWRRFERRNINDRRFVVWRN